MRNICQRNRLKKKIPFNSLPHHLNKKQYAMIPEKAVKTLMMILISTMEKAMKTLMTMLILMMEKAMNILMLILMFEMRFLYAPRMEEFILKKMEKDEGNKAKLKELYFDVNETKEANCNNVPEGVLFDQWIALANHWMNEKSKRISEQNKKNYRKEKAIHTAGTKGFACRREEMVKHVLNSIHLVGGMPRGPSTKLPKPTQGCLGKS